MSASESPRATTDSAPFEPSHSHRGKLKVYLGFAPGVGKTCAMLNEAHELQRQGLNVMVGVVETHGRKRTAELVEGLTVIPRKKTTYRGRVFEELDVDACLALAPDVLLVDELAHTVVTGDAEFAATEVSQKRWQDVYTLLDAGIDVISTLNIQHLESLNDVVAAVTNTRQRETIPDQVLRDTDHIELVDLSPDSLRIRLARGEIYHGAMATKALENYFRLGNLTALRELALLWLADKVEEGLAAYRENHEIDSTWPTRERLIVAVSGSDGSEALIRRAARIAGRVSGREMVAVYVASNEGLTSNQTPSALRRLQELVEDLNGQWRVLIGDDVAGTLLEYARSINASQLVIGRRPRWGHTLANGVAERVIDGSGTIDVHIVSLSSSDDPQPKRPRRGTIFGRVRLLTGWFAALLFPPGFTVLMLLFNPEEKFLSPILLGFLTIVVFSAIAAGVWPALLAVISGSLLANWFFTAPTHTLSITEPESITSVGFFIIIALTVAYIVDYAERRADEAKRRQTQAVIMADLARGVIYEGADLKSLLRRLGETFSLDKVLLQRYSSEDKKWWTIESNAESSDVVVAQQKSRAGESANHVGIGDSLRLVIGNRELSPSEIDMIEAHGARITAILDRQEMEAMRRATSALESSNRVGSTLLTAVSHDLRTPLAGITTAVSGLTLGDVEISEADRQALINTIESSAHRLEIVINHLLDMSRLNTGMLRPNSQAIDVADIVDAALDEHSVSAGGVRVDIPVTLPPILADYGLIQRVLANVIANAVNHGAGTHIDITAREAHQALLTSMAHAKDAPSSVVADDAASIGPSGRRDDHNIVQIRIADHGPGIPRDQWDSLFLPFQRLSDDALGLGLGLAVARGFTEAMGGHIYPAETPGGGATIVIEMPCAPTPEGGKQ